MLKVHEFFSVAAQIALNAAKIIHEVRISPDIGKQWKGQDDPVTIADIKAQTYMVSQLNKFWPKLRIVGEESTTYEGQIEFDQVNDKLYSVEFFNKTPNNLQVRTEYEIEKLCVWLDPLDGTLDFVMNNLENVTTLIGVSYNNQPLLGVVSQLYQKEGEQYIFKPKVYFGNSEQKRIYYIYEQFEVIPFELIRPKRNYGRQRFVTAKQRITQENLKKIQDLDVDIFQTGGSGKKSLLLLEGEADFYIHIGQKTSRWDTCATQALIQCFNGQLRGLAAQQYDYNPDEKEYYNIHGVLATLGTDEVFHKYVQLTKSHL